MDTVTHTMMAFSLALLLKGQSIEKSDHFKIPLIFGAILPDLDYIVNVIGVSSTIVRHRGMFHSLIGIIPSVLLVSLIWFIPKFKTEAQCKYWKFLLLLYGGAIFHIMTDLLGSGIMIGFPFSFKLYAPINLDLYYQYGLALGFILGTMLIAKLWNTSLFREKNHPKYFYVIGIKGVIFKYSATIIWSVYSFDELNSYIPIIVCSTTFFIMMMLLLIIPLLPEKKPRIKVAERNIY